MKIIHCADLHLDSKMTTNLTKEKAKERKIEILRTFTRMVEFAKKNKVEVILLAGDLFDTRNVSVKVRNTVRDVICANPEIDFLYLKGNHDNDNFLSKLEEIPHNLHLFGDTWTTYRYGGVAITGLELNGQNTHTAYNTLVLEHNDFNIVTMHGQLAGYKSRKQTEVISLDDLKNKNIDYLALGHVHEYKTDHLDHRGVWCYSGCLEGRGFDECGEKGFVLLDIDPLSREMQMQFVPMASRSMYVLPVDITGVMTTQEAAVRVEEAIHESGISSKHLVKICLIGEVDVSCEVDTDYLEEQFSEFFYFEKVRDETSLIMDYSAYEKDMSLKGEFVRMVSLSDHTQEEKAKIIRTGILALQGEEI